MARREQAFRPGTRRNHSTQLTLYLAFCTHLGVSEIQPSPWTICLYLEYLARHMCSPTVVLAYTAIIRLFHQAQNLECLALDSHEVRMMTRAIPLTMRHKMSPKSPMSVKLMGELLTVSHALGRAGVVWRCAILFAFHGFLRQSNLAPSSQKTFDPDRHTCRGDITKAPPGLIVHLRWLKNNQEGLTSDTVPLTRTATLELCPVRAYEQMCTLVPTTNARQPHFLVPQKKASPIQNSDRSLAGFCTPLSVSPAGGKPKQL